MMTSTVGEYINIKPKSHPSYVVTKISGLEIRSYAEKYFRGRLLDIGCGEKFKAKLISDLVEEYVGLDHEGTQHSKRQVDIFGTAYNIPVEDESFDSVLCTSVLEHLEEPQVALVEAYRILKPGGFVIYTVPFYWHVHEAPRDFFRYSKFALRYLFEKANFRIIEIKPLGGFWITFLTELNYYLTRFKRIKWVIKLIILWNNFLMSRLDTMSKLRDENFTWLYLIVAKKDHVK